MPKYYHRPAKILTRVNLGKELRVYSLGDPSWTMKRKLKECIVSLRFLMKPKDVECVQPHESETNNDQEHFASLIKAIKGTEVSDELNPNEIRHKGVEFEPPLINFEANANQEYVFESDWLDDSDPNERGKECLICELSTRDKDNQTDANATQLNAQIPNTANSGAIDPSNYDEFQYWHS